MTSRRIALAALFAGAVGVAPVSQVVYDRAVMECGVDQTLDTPLPLRSEHVWLAADGRLFSPCALQANLGSPAQPHPADHREMREWDVIGRAALAADPEFKRQAAQAYGRVQAPIETITRLLSDRDPRVRREAVRALGAAVRPATLEPATRHDDPGPGRTGRGQRTDNDADVAAVSERLTSRLDRESDGDVIATILETLGGLPYPGGSPGVETILVEHIPRTGSPRQLRGAVMGLEALFRRGRGRGNPPAAETIRRLREVVRHPMRNQPIDPDAPGDGSIADLETYALARRAALLALNGARDADVDTVVTAMRDVDWQVRRIAAARMNAEMPEFATSIAAALKDPAFQVRIEALRVIGRIAGRTGECAALVTALDDDVPAVVMAAMDQLQPACARQETWLPGLVATASELGSGASLRAWHEPARALVALARIAPDAARPLLETAALHAVWQVRATAAEVAQTLREEATTTALADDLEPNVRTAALRALRGLQSPQLADAAIEALQGDDYDLIRTAASVLQSAPADRRAEASTALMFKLSRLTSQGFDTSRDPRVAILERLGDLLDPSQASSLISYFSDFDPAVAAAATAAFERLTGAPPAPGGAASYRYPYQPSVDTLASLPTTATILMEGGGVIELELLGDVAPVSTARFAELATSGYYNGLTFHRFAQNFVVQGGSPGASEYSGVPRYWRDEIGASNLRGTVGLSTRGRDTADGQIFINLVDNLRLDGDYTVFARVVSGMDVVDRILPGARMERVTVK